MSLYLPGIPTGLVPLNNDYLNIQHNFTQLDTTFGVDHYRFSDATPNNGFHNTVTTPIASGSVHPATAANVPKFYGMQDSANLGVIQYSRGGANPSPVPSPVTILQSQAGAITILNNTSVNIFDFTGLTRAMGCFTAANLTALNTTDFTRNSIIFWDGTEGKIKSVISNGFSMTFAGNILTLRNNSILPPVDYFNVYWSLQFYRLQ